MPYIGSAPPTIYEAGGEQFIMIPATGSWSLKNVYPDLEYGDAFLSFKLKKLMNIKKILIYNSGGGLGDAIQLFSLISIKNLQES